MNEFSDYLKHIKILLKDFRAAVDPFLDETLLKNKQDQLKSIENTINRFIQGNVRVPKEHLDFKLNLIREIKLTNDAINANQEFINILQSNLTPLIFFTRSEQQTHLHINESSQVSESEGNFNPANQQSVQSVLSGLSKEDLRLKKAEITLSDIIEAKIIPPGTVILKEFQNTTYRGIITEDGKITLKGFNKATYDDPHSAVKAITDVPIDGWKWWNVFTGYLKRPLDDLRVIYLERNS